MGKIVAIGIFLLSLTSWPTTVFLNKLGILKNERIILLSGGAYIALVLLAILLLFRRYFKNVDKFMYVFSLFCLDATCSLGSALETDGILKVPGVSNVSSVEPYQQTAYGVVSDYWNGSVHYLLSLAAIALYINRDSHREVVFYLAGSLLNNVVVLLQAYVAGTEKVLLETALLKGVYIVLAIVVILYYVEKRPTQARTFIKFEPIWKRPADLFFFIFFVVAILIAVFTGSVASTGKGFSTKFLDVYDPYLKDVTLFPKWQALVYEYLFVVYYLSAIYGLINPGQHWMADWSLVHAGAAAQSQFTYIASSLHRKTSPAFRSPLSGVPAVVFWAIHLTLFIVPHLFAWRCHKDPENFGRTYTVDLATPVQTYTVTSSRRYVKTSKAE